MYNKRWLKRTQSCFNSTYQFLQAFGGHRLHYQVHINAKRKLFARIDEQFSTFANNISNRNK